MLSLILKWRIQELKIFKKYFMHIFLMCYGVKMFQNNQIPLIKIVQKRGEYQS